MSAAVARRCPAVQPFGPRLRAKVEAAIERLIATLDALDGDPDLEEDPEGVNEDGDILDAGEFCEAEASDRWRRRFGAAA